MFYNNVFIIIQKIVIYIFCISMQSNNKISLT